MDGVWRVTPEEVCATEGAAGSACMAPGFGWVVLRRHGMRPLRFMGRALLQTHGQWRGDGWAQAWHTLICVYERSDGGAGASVRHDLAGLAWHFGWSFSDPLALLPALLAHDPAFVLPMGDGDESARRAFWADFLAGALCVTRCV